MKEELEKKCYIDKVYSFENFVINEKNIEKINAHFINLKIIKILFKYYNKISI